MFLLILSSCLDVSPISCAHAMCDLLDEDARVYQSLSRSFLNAEMYNIALLSRSVVWINQR